MITPSFCQFFDWNGLASNAFVRTKAGELVREGPETLIGYSPKRGRRLTQPAPLQEALLPREQVHLLQVLRRVPQEQEVQSGPE